MIWAILLMVAAAESAKLNNAYLPPPPPRAQLAGGSDGALEVPLEPPYVDPYTPSATQNEDDLQNGEVENPLPPLPKHGKFLSGSYTYTGPDNVLVTVTFKANEKIGRSLLDEDNEEENDFAHTEKSLTLPKDLSRALDFGQEKKQYPKHGLSSVDKQLANGGYAKDRQPYDGPSPKNYDFGQRLQPQESIKGQGSRRTAVNNNEGYQYSKPAIHQGYSRSAYAEH